jgi:nucleoside-diphosphate-sugar epimerase
VNDDGHLYFAQMNARKKMIIVGFGDVAQRLARLLRGRYDIYALLRPHDNNGDWRARLQAARDLGVIPISGDLANAASLLRIANLMLAADCVFHFAPPPNRGANDIYTRNLLASMSRASANGHTNRQTKRAAMLPHRLVYISTTGVYGDCQGAQIDESRPVNPQTDRACRRVDAEAQLRFWGARNQVCVSILRAPGIYAIDRLPIERLQRSTPALRAEDDVYTNHIHADDLARAAWCAARFGKSNRIYNVVDDSEMLMAAYFDQVADHFGLSRPMRVSRAEAPQHISLPMLSFMGESRRISNTRLKRELQLTLRHATVTSFLASLPKQPVERA